MAGVGLHGQSRHALVAIGAPPRDGEGKPPSLPLALDEGIVHPSVNRGVFENRWERTAEEKLQR
jgi:hypothetical protein